MWMIPNRINNINPSIFIDCRSSFNDSHIAPTYRLAMKENVTRGQIFAIDNIFFALFFLKGLDEFKESSAVIYSSNTMYHVFDKKYNNCFHITEITLSKNIPVHIMNIGWISNNFEDFEKSLDCNNIFGKGTIIFNKIGYITINLGA